MTNQICYERLLNYHQPGGESLLNEEETNKIKLKFTENDSPNISGYLAGEINDLNLNSSSVFQPSCFYYDCFEGSGLWTTAVKSSITRIVGEETQYWVEGSLDSENNLWVLDLGFISPYTGQFNIQDKSVPINNDGSFKSRLPISAYSKVALLKKITETDVTPILNSFGSYSTNNKISRSYSNYLLEYTAEDQKSYLEDISIGLLSLLFSTYKNDKTHQHTFYAKGELDYNLKNIINDNVSSIVSLIDSYSNSKRLNSIPNELSTYLTPELLYNDEHYLNNIVKCFDTSCFSSECFEESEINITTSRAVSTKAVAWFYILLYTYGLYTANTQYNYLLDSIAYYLSNQINYKYQLPSKGWTHSDILLDSQEIEEYDLATAVTVYLALLKHYTYSSDITFLERATDIQEGIFTHLYNFKSLNFYSSINSSTISLSNISYGLLFSILIKRVDIAESLIESIENNLVIDYGIVKEEFQPPSTVNLIDKLSLENLINNPIDLNFTTLETVFNLTQVVKDSTLLVLALNLAQLNNYYLSPKLNNYLNIYLNNLEEKEKLNNFFTTSYCLTNLNPFNLEVISQENYGLTSDILSERIFLLNKIKSLIPIEFGWFSPQALSISGNTYKLLKSISKVLGGFKTFNRDFIKNNFLSASKQYKLNSIASIFSTFRIPQELDESLKTYTQSILKGEEDKITEKGLVKRLNRFGITASVYETYNSIFRLNEEYTSKKSLVLGEGYYSGNDYASTHIVELLCQQPIKENISREIISALPISVIPIVKELITLEDDYTDHSSCYKYTEINNNELTSCVLQENSYKILQQNSNCIILEDIITVETSNILQENNEPLYQENSEPLYLENN